MKSRYRLGIDLGGTKIEGLVFDGLHGKESFRRRVPTQSHKGYRGILENINGLYKSLVREIKGARHTLGIGTPGAVSPRTGLLKNSNTVCMNGKPLTHDLKGLIRKKLVIENDANCFALAEARLGAGRGKSTVFGVIMGTGCGGGIVREGDVLAGPQRIAGEWGHMAVDPRGPKCYCGRRGCVETFISGGGLERRWEKETGGRLSLAEIVTRSRRKDKAAVRFMKTFFEDFGRAMANLINILDPDIVVLGGGVSNVRELYTKGLSQVRARVFSDSLETPIVRNELGDSAGVLGAALIGE